MPSQAARLAGPPSRYLRRLAALLRTGRVVNFGNVGVFRAGNLDASADLFSRSAELAGQAGDNLLLTYIYHGMGYLTLARNELMAGSGRFPKKPATVYGARVLYDSHGLRGGPRRGCRRSR